MCISCCLLSAARERLYVLLDGHDVRIRLTILPQTGETGASPEERLSSKRWVPFVCDCCGFCDHLPDNLVLYP